MPHGRTVCEDARITQPLYENQLANVRANADRFRTKSKSTVAKKTKKTSPSDANPEVNAPPSLSALAESIARPSRKRPAVTKSAARTTSPKKKTAGSATKKAAAKRSGKVSKAKEPSDADIRLRAYFIAERRVQQALQGDPANDWLEAKQQLLREAQETDG